MLDSNRFQRLVLAFNCILCLIVVQLLSNGYYFRTFDKRSLSLHQSAIRFMSPRNTLLSSAQASSPTTATTSILNTTFSANATLQLPTGVPANRTKNLYMVLRGRFGNILFEIAGAYSMELGANCKKLFFKDSNPPQINRLIQFFPKLKSLIHSVSSIPRHLKKVQEFRFNKYRKDIHNQVSAATQDVYLYAYLGVPSYWWPKYEKEVKDLLAVSEDFQTRARNYLLQIASMQNVSLEERKDTLKSGISPKLAENVPVLVGLQIRRGDKAKHYRSRAGWVVAEEPYFLNAMNYFRSKFQVVYFIVVSQDKRWAKQNIVGKDVIYSTTTEDLLEFTLLTLCDHFILSVGTFGWWAGFLTGGDVVYFANHVKPNSSVAHNFNNTEYFLPSWKPLV